MQDTADLLVDPQYAARNLVKTEVKGKSVKAAGAPFKLFPAPWQYVSQPPAKRMAF